MNIVQMTQAFIDQFAQDQCDVGSTPPGYREKTKRDALFVLKAFNDFAKSRRLELTVTPIPLTPLEALRALVDAADRFAQVDVCNCDVYDRVVSDAITTLKAHDA